MDIISTYRMDEVIDMIKNKLGYEEESEEINNVFSSIYQRCCPKNFEINPECLLYDEKIVIEELSGV
jgi:hypothetical protein